MRILVADDDATSRLVLKAAVTRLGHECLVAEDGSRAWELLASEEIDVLLTDWMMPGLDGPELCRRVREELTSHYTYVVLVTGLGEREQVVEGMSAGADDYLIKPVDPFIVLTRMIAADRVTALQRRVTDMQAQLTEANNVLRDLSRTDPLTSLGNRRRLEEDLEGIHARAQRTARPFGVALFDVDHFKLYNDHYGHLEGDEALRQVARCIGAVMRAGENAYRYGGEEFLILLPDCDLDGAVAAAERVRRVVEDQAIPHQARPSPPALVTLSGAAGSWTAGSALSTAAVLERVDEALYDAKSAGRNRIHAVADHRAAPVSGVRSGRA
jgi:diguanylate cyclase (GGDEF)-like protein